MGNKDSKNKNSDTITPAVVNQKVDHADSKKPAVAKKAEKKELTKKKSKQQQMVTMPVDANATLKNKEFLNELSVFIVKAYDTNFHGTFNDFMVIFCIKIKFWGKTLL